MGNEHFTLASSFFGIDVGDLFRSFLLWIAAYLGTKHGTINANGNGNGH